VLGGRRHLHLQRSRHGRITTAQRPLTRTLTSPRRARFGYVLSTRKSISSLVLLIHAVRGVLQPFLKE